MYVIVTEQMVGFMKKHMVAANVLESIPIIGIKAIINTLRRIILVTVNTMLPGGGGVSDKRKCNITSESMKMFMIFLRYIISSAVYGVVNTF